jgi:chaperonin cofactor prefoldin
VASHSLASADAEEMPVADEYLDYSKRLAEYIKQLERRLKTAEKSNESKARRIETMQEEIDK